MRILSAVIYILMSVPALAHEYSNILPEISCSFRNFSHGCTGTPFPQRIDIDANGDSFEFYIEQTACHSRYARFSSGKVLTVVDTPSTLIAKLNFTLTKTEQAWQEVNYTYEISVERSTMRGFLTGIVYTDGLEGVSYNLKIPLSCHAYDRSPVTVF